MSRPATRRVALRAGAAAIGALCAPAAALAIAAPAVDLDAELFALLDRYPVARAANKAASDHEASVWAAYCKAEPDRPRALFVHVNDAFGCGSAVETLPNGIQVELYDPAAVCRLRAKPAPTREEWQGRPAPWNPEEKVGRWVRVPDVARVARRDEILAAHNRWTAECEEVQARLGVTAAEQAEEATWTALCGLEAEILAAAPRTVAGLVRKAEWALAAPYKPDEAEWHRRVVEDVVGLAGGVRVAA